MCSVIRGQSKVETQNLASHKQGYAINQGDEMPAIAVFYYSGDANGRDCQRHIINTAH